MAVEQHEVRRDTIAAGTPIKSVERTAKVLTGGFLGEGLGGLAVVVLAILGLIGLLPLLLLSIAGIVAGAALTWEGATVLSQFDKVVSGAGFGSRVRIEAGSLGLFCGGLGGLVLCIMALLGIHSLALISISAIVYGAVLMPGSFVTYGIELALPWENQRPTEAFPGSRVGSSGIEVMTGIGAIVLGILSLAGVVPLTLNLVALLAIGGAAFFASMMTSAEFMKAL